MEYKVGDKIFLQGSPYSFDGVVFTIRSIRVHPNRESDYELAFKEYDPDFHWSISNKWIQPIVTGAKDNFHAKILKKLKDKEEEKNECKERSFSSYNATVTVSYDPSVPVTPSYSYRYHDGTGDYSQRCRN